MLSPLKSHFLTYQTGRGETNVFRFEPYKSALLPHWRFKTVPIATESSGILYQKLLGYYDERDFVGMDMAKKFIQMSMTRAKCHADYKGGRKFVNGKEKGRKIEKNRGHHNHVEKEEARSRFSGSVGQVQGTRRLSGAKEHFARAEKVEEDGEARVGAVQGRGDQDGARFKDLNGLPIVN